MLLLICVLNLHCTIFAPTDHLLELLYFIQTPSSFSTVRFARLISPLDSEYLKDSRTKRHSGQSNMNSEIISSMNSSDKRTFDVPADLLSSLLLSAYNITGGPINVKNSINAQATQLALFRTTAFDNNSCTP